jgi:hypothetical protein
MGDLQAPLESLSMRNQSHTVPFNAGRPQQKLTPTLLSQIVDNGRAYRRISIEHT